MSSPERQLEEELVAKLCDLKYEYRADIRDRATLEKNFREKFQVLNQVKLTEGEFQRLLEEIITPDVFSASKTLRGINSFTRDDGTPLNYTLVNIKDWCKNSFEVVNQLRINTDYSHHRYDVMLPINGRTGRHVSPRPALHPQGRIRLDRGAPVRTLILEDMGRVWCSNFLGLDGCRTGATWWKKFVECAVRAMICDAWIRSHATSDLR